MKSSYQSHRRTLGSVTACLTLAATLLCSGSALADNYLQTNLVSDIPGMAANLDPNLINPWGISFSPTGPFWISDNNSGLTTIYDGLGVPASLVVSIPSPTNPTSGGTPTGQVFNGTNDFVVTSATGSGPAIFIFANEDGTISGWNPGASFPSAILAADRSAKGTVYKGLALAPNKFGNFLFATDFHNGKIDMFNHNFKYVHSFTDPSIPAGFAPFNIQYLSSSKLKKSYLVVTYAKQRSPDKHDDQAGPGNGFIDAFDTLGHLVKHFAAHGALNSPWGLAVAPDNFGKFSGALLVGNFGDGWINAYSIPDGRYLGALSTQNSYPIAIDGLWGLSFGNGGGAGQTNTLYFTAGVNHEADGLFGSIQAL